MKDEKEPGEAAYHKTTKITTEQRRHRDTQCKYNLLNDWVVVMGTDGPPIVFGRTSFIRSYPLLQPNR